MTTIVDTKLYEYRLRKQYDETRGIIYRRLHQADDPLVMAFANRLAEVEDWVEADQLNDIDVAQCELELRELRDIDSALLRIRRGTYGVCEECGEEISSDRLDANPCALRCFDCQQKSEQLLSRQSSASL